MSHTPARRDRWVDLAVSLVVAGIVLGPMLVRRGYALRGDMVFVPHQPWKDSWLGLDGSVARFVPGDALLSVATALVPGDLVQKLLLLGALTLAGTGAGRLVAEHAMPARSAAVVLYCWNPWVLERLSIGQWGSVVGYAALPWLVVAAERFREQPRAGWPTVVLWLGFAALWSPSSAIAATLTALCVVGVGRRLAPVGLVLAASVVVNLPWLVPSVLAPSRLEASGSQFEAFAARAESGAGLLASLVSGGGIWKTAIVPGERTVAVVVLLAAVPTVLALCFLPLARRAAAPPRRSTLTGLVVLAGLSLLVALLPATDVVGGWLDSAADVVPAVGLVRDSHRFLGPAFLVLLPGVAAAVAWLWALARPGREAVRAVAVLVVLLPVLCLPSMAWGLHRELDPVTYPGEWFEVSDLLADTPDGATVVLPWRGSYRGYAWNERRAVLDPAPRFFPGQVLVDDRLIVGDRVLGHEDPRLAAVTDALAAEDPATALREAGVARVLVEKGNGVHPDETPEGRVVHDGRWLTLVELGPATGPLLVTDPPRAAVLTGDVVTLLALLVAAGCAIGRNVYGVRRLTERGRDEQ